MLYLYSLYSAILTLRPPVFSASSVGKMLQITHLDLFSKSIYLHFAIVRMAL